MFLIWSVRQEKQWTRCNKTKQNINYFCTVRSRHKTHTHTLSSSISLFSLSLALRLSCHNILIDCARTAIGVCRHCWIERATSNLRVYTLYQKLAAEIRLRQTKSHISNSNALSSTEGPKSWFHTKMLHFMHNVSKTQPSIAYDLHSFSKIYSQAFARSLSFALRVKMARVEREKSSIEFNSFKREAIP